MGFISGAANTGIQLAMLGSVATTLPLAFGMGMAAKVITGVNERAHAYAEGGVDFSTITSPSIALRRFTGLSVLGAGAAVKYGFSRFDAALERRVRPEWLK